MSERLEDYDYELPEGLIATRPLARRDASRMLVLDRGTGEICHARIADLPDFLHPGDLAVLNDSRVIRARLQCEDWPGEVFLIERMGERLWKCLVKPGKKFRLGATVSVAANRARVVELVADGTRVVEFEREPDLERDGQMPIPPYFQREADESDIERYQTTFARVSGSVAAPTAGLHFTPGLLGRIPHVFLTLHVGLGTFQPVKTEDISRHVMHEESYSLDSGTAAALNSAGRILAVGTTTARVLESQPPGLLQASAGRTAIFIRPPHAFRHVGALLTNFHLPRSTLLMLVSAFAGRENTLRAYREAVRERYRFYSYGDCLLIIESRAGNHQAPARPKFPQPAAR